MKTGNAIVLLSGGLDSVAALLWASERYDRIHALSADYGQPSRDQELGCAQRTAAASGVDWGSLKLSDAMRASGLLLGKVQHNQDRFGGLHPAFVPGRNLILVAVATAHACVLFPSGNIDVIIGANRDDAEGFPDCRPTTLAKQSEALRAGVARQVNVVAPWSFSTKADILRTVAKHPLAEFVYRSWSCYTARGPCGACSACLKRAGAFAEVGTPDLCEEQAICGGDPARERG